MAPAVLTRHAAWRWLGVAGVFVVLTAVNTYPLVFGLGTSVGHHGDALFSTWRLAWVAHQMRADPRALFDANIFFPEPNTLAYSDAMLLPAVSVAPLAWAGVDPLVVYNVTLLTAFVLSGLAGYALVRALTGSEIAAIAAGAIFAFSPHRLEHFDHLEMQFAFWIALAALAWHKAVERESVASHLLVTAAASAQVLSSIYHGIFLLVWLAVMTAAWHIRDPRRLLRAAGLQLAVPVLVLAAYSVPYLDSRESVGERGITEIAIYSAEPVDFLSAPSSSRLYGWTSEVGANERHLFPGVAAFTLLVVGSLVGWRHPRLRVHLAGLGVAILLTFGLNAGLYGLLYDYVLPFRGLRVPARAAILILLATAVLGGVGLAHVLGRLGSPRRRAIVGALALGAIVVECLAAPSLVPVSRDRSPWYAALKKMPDAVVFEWPVTVPWRLYDMRDVEYMFRSTAHWRPLLNGYSGNYPKSYRQLLVAMRSFPFTSSLEFLRHRGATVLVVHERQGTRPNYDDAIERLHRDPDVALIGQGRDSGHRLSFFKLLPKEPRREAHAATGVRP